MIILAYLGGFAVQCRAGFRITGLPIPVTMVPTTRGDQCVRLGGRMAALIVLFSTCSGGMAPSISPGICRSNPSISVLSCRRLSGPHVPLLPLPWRPGSPPPSVPCCPSALPWGAVIATWLLVLLVSGYSSLASIVTVLLTRSLPICSNRNIPCRSPALLSHPDPSSREHLPACSRGGVPPLGPPGSGPPAEVMKWMMLRKKRRTRRKGNFPLTTCPKIRLIAPTPR